MPWCDECDKYLAPNTVTAEASCPTCDGEVDVADMKVEVKDGKAPWHFWLVVGALVLYLGWRLVDGVIWLIARF